MRYFITGDKAYNARMYEHHAAPMRNHIATMREQVDWLLARLNNLHTLSIRPDPNGECDGPICDADTFKLVHTKVADAAAALATLYREVERRAQREVARTQLQTIDGVI